MKFPSFIKRNTCLPTIPTHLIHKLTTSTKVNSKQTYTSIPFKKFSFSFTSWSWSKDPYFQEKTFIHSVGFSKCTLKNPISSLSLSLNSTLFKPSCHSSWKHSTSRLHSFSPWCHFIHPYSLSYTLTLPFHTSKRFTSSAPNVHPSSTSSLPPSSSPSSSSSSSRKPLTDDEKRRALMWLPFEDVIDTFKWILVSIGVYGLVSFLHACYLHIQTEYLVPTPSSFGWRTRHSLRKMYLAERALDLNSADQYLSQAIETSLKEYPWKVWKRPYLALLLKQIQLKWELGHHTEAIAMLKAVQGPLIQKLNMELDVLSSSSSSFSAQSCIKKHPSLFVLVKTILLLETRLIHFLSTKQCVSELSSLLKLLPTQLHTWLPELSLLSPSSTQNDLPTSLSLLNESFHPSYSLPVLMTTVYLSMVEGYKALNQHELVNQALQTASSTLQLIQPPSPSSSPSSSSDPNPNYYEASLPELLPFDCIRAMLYFQQAEATLFRSSSSSQILKDTESIKKTTLNSILHLYSQSLSYSQLNSHPSCSLCRATTFLALGKLFLFEKDEVQAYHMFQQGLNLGRDLKETSIVQTCSQYLKRLEAPN